MSVNLVIALDDALMQLPGLAADSQMTLRLDLRDTRYHLRRRELVLQPFAILPGLRI
jgi:hypothetical protein